MKLFEAYVYVKQPDGRELPQKVRVNADGSMQARQLMAAYGRVVGVPHEVH